ncbi:MAG: malto-oligosyltrehalose synthase, partial [Actinomycetia bacterium]|nr:malto-oligosyltrehalose synthase [Actinomycetes bacterium]
APPASAAVLARAAAGARPRLPERLHATLDAMVGLVLGRDGEHAQLIVAFQQVCGPVMAKGVEDTAFYRWSRLAALNEVGGDPDSFGTSPGEFHEFAARLARDWPASMTTLSTHDTKRQEDVRARLAVLAEIPEAWAAEVTRWHERAAALASGAAPEPDTGYLMWQTLAGAWPLDRERLTGYLRKAMREAKSRTSWTDPDAEYESQVMTFAELVLDDEELTGQIARFVAGLDADARANALGAKLVQLTMPGVADTYQGCELAGLRLVDPDNRAPAEFARARDLLAALDAGEPSAALDAGPLDTGPLDTGPLDTGKLDTGKLDTGKLLVTAAALRLRREHPDWFAGEYAPLAAEGPAARHAISFARGGPAVTVATRLPAGLRSGGGWAGTVLPLPHAGPWRDLLTGASHPGERPLLSDLLHRLPVALLVEEHS